MRRLVLALLAIGVLAATTPSALAGGPLVIDPSALRGFRAFSVSAGTMARALAPAKVRRAQIETAGARSRRLTIESGAVVLRRGGSATRVLAAWTRAAHARRVAVGGGGAVWLHSRRGVATAVVVWRDGTRIGLVVLKGSSRLVTARTAAGYARLSDIALRSVLPSTAIDRVLDETGSRGQVTRQMALDALAVAFGHFPGGHRPAGPAGSVDSATPIIQWALRYAPTMNPMQRRTLARLLGYRSIAARAAAAKPPPLPQGLDDGTFVPDPTLRRYALDAAQEYTALLPRPGGLHNLTPLVGTSDNVARIAAADAEPIDPSGAPWKLGTHGICFIRLARSQAKDDEATLRFFMAHEMFHCFEADIQNPALWNETRPWVEEGLAEWAATTVSPESPRRHLSANFYRQRPRSSLFARQYTAEGFFGHVQDTTHDMWSRAQEVILAADDDDKAFEEAGGKGETLLSTWGSSLFQSYPEPAWQIYSPVNAYEPGWPLVPPGGLVEVRSDEAIADEPASANPYVIEPNGDAPLVHVEINGHARLRIGANDDTTLGDAWFCTATGCECPSGSEGTLPHYAPLPTPAPLGVTGDPGTGTSGFISFHSLDEFCHPKPKPPSTGGGGGGGGGGGAGGTGGSGGSGGSGGGGPLGCSSACGSSNGDPHLTTLDGYDYDFQAAGEFTAVKSTADDLEIQERQQPFGSPNVSVNTAVAMRVAGERVEIDPGESLLARINGVRTTLSGTPRALTGGGTVAERSGAVVVTWPDGSQAQLWSVGPWGVAYLFEPAPTRAGHLEGLLGDLDSDRGRLRGRDGRVYAVAALEGKRGFAVKYHAFGESWRVNQAGSLFTYAHGKSTRSYTDRSLPRRLVTLASLPASARTTARATCRRQGITSPAILGDCELDVGATRRSAFARSHASLQHIARTRHALTPPGGTPPVGPPPSSGGGTLHFTTTCYTEDGMTPAGTDQTVPPGTSVGIGVMLEPLPNDAQYTIHWTVPPGEDYPPDTRGSGATDEFPTLESPGHYTAQAIYLGGASHPSARSAVCSWTVTG